MSGAAKVALVTGSGKKRVGRAVADALAERGYALAVHYRGSATEAAEAVASYRSRGRKAEAFQADLQDETAVRRLIEETIAHFGRLDVLVTCASLWHKQKLEELTAAEVRTLLDVNTLGTFLCCQHAGLAMVNQPEGGSIITVGDWATVRPYINYAGYLISKGTLPTLTRCFAVELGTRNPAVRVNCILPGPVLLAEDLPADERNQAIDATLLKRVGRPENVAQATLFLIDNDFVTGSCLTVDGGRSMFAPDSVI